VEARYDGNGNYKRGLANRNAAHPQGAAAADVGNTNQHRYGTALGAAQLNATASVPGSFSYTPEAGTVLSLGTHTLTASFAPADSVNYDGASASVVARRDESAGHDHLAGAGRHRLRHGARRRAVECDGQRAGHLQLFTGTRDGAERGLACPDGLVHAGG
jgi:hypothetical protein